MRTAARDAESTNISTGETILDLIRSLSAELHPTRSLPASLTIDHSLDKDFGLDSLARVELISRVEDHFGVTLPERVFAETETPRDLLRFIGTAPGATPPPVRDTAHVAAQARNAGAPDGATTLIEALSWHVNTHPERTHIQFYKDQGEGEAICYQDLWSNAITVAAALQTRGINPGEPVALMLPTSAAYFYCFFGVLLAGAVPVSLYPPARRAQIADHLRRHKSILGNCQAKTLITVSEAKPFTRLLKSLVDTIEHVDDAAELQGDPGLWREPSVQASDTAFLQYTSGSTGDPKGVVLTHANLLVNIRAMGTAVNADANDVFVSWLPLYHDMGLIGAWLGSLYYGSLFVVMPPLSFIARPERWLWAIHRYRGTLSAAPNFAYELCVRRVANDALKELDISSWRGAFNGAEPVDPNTLEEFCERYGAYGFRRESMMPVYGLAESSVGLAFPPLNRGPHIDKVRREAFATTGVAIPAEATDRDALSFPSCGIPLPGHQVRVVDENQRELPERHEGYVHFRGPSTTSGYYRNQAATQRLFKGDWLDSGDRGYLSEGELYVTGRVKDIIIRAGRNIYPHELEEAVGSVDGVRQGRVAVFGSTNVEAGTEKLVVMAESRSSNPEKIESIRNAINDVAVVLTGDPADDVVIAPPNTVLKTSSGKIRRAACRELYETGRIGKQRADQWWQWARLTMTSFVPVMRRIRRQIGSYAYAAFLWTMLYALAIPTWLAVAVLPCLEWRWRTMGFFARLLIKLVRIPFQVRGLENLPPAHGQAVFVSNHASYLDGIILVAVLPYPVTFVAKAELEKKFVPRVFLRGIHAAFVERFEKAKSVADAGHLSALARGGHPVFFFPEGTFTRQPGLLPFRMGAFIAAVEAQTEVVPITIRGTRSVLRSESWFPHFGPISVIVAPPIKPGPPPEGASERERWNAALKLRDAAREAILKVGGEPDLAREHHPI